MTLSDEQLLKLARAGDTAALDALLNRFKPLVKAKAKAYYMTGGDHDDLIQEGMIGLYKAVLDFDASKSGFAAFASLCVVRQVRTAVKAASRHKHIPLNTSLSLDNEVQPDSSSEEPGETYLAKLPDRVINDPEALFLGLEASRDINDFIQRNLSPLEYSVLMLHIDGKSLAEIADALGKNKKSVDNTLQRIRQKVGKGIQKPPN